MTISSLSNSLAASTKPADLSTKTAADPLTQKNTFLQLLVAQIRNQNPLKPTEGTEFLTQLAQFSSLEQSIQLKDEVGSVRTAIETLIEAVKNSQKSSTGVPQP